MFLALCQGEGMEIAELDDGTDLAVAVHDAAAVSWSVRAAAGRRLAAAASVPGIAEILKGLLLDGDDTMVCQETADALMQREDVYGLRLVLAALARAEEPSFPEQSVMDHLHDSIMSDARWMTVLGPGHLKSQFLELLEDPDQSVRAQARRYLHSSYRVEG